MTTTTTTIASEAQRIRHAETMIDGYRQMLVIARNLNMEYEIERLTRNMNEYDEEIHDAIDNLVGMGVTPEQMDSI